MSDEGNFHVAVALAFTCSLFSSACSFYLSARSWTVRPGGNARLGTKVSSAYGKYSRVANSGSITGAAVARRLLQANGLDSIHGPLPT